MIAVDDANLGADELKIPRHGIQRRPQIPSRVDQGGVVHDERLDGSLRPQFVDDFGVNGTFNWSLDTATSNPSKTAFKRLLLPSWAGLETSKP